MDRVEQLRGLVVEAGIKACSIALVSLTEGGYSSESFAALVTAGATAFAAVREAADSAAPATAKEAQGFSEERAVSGKSDG